jgi:hypothetical protein
MSAPHYADPVLGWDDREPEKSPHKPFDNFAWRDYCHAKKQHLHGLNVRLFSELKEKRLARREWRTWREQNARFTER